MKHLLMKNARYVLSLTKKNIHLIGPEKVTLFTCIDIPSTFPELHSKDKLQNLWKNFSKPIRSINEDTCNAVDIDAKAKT